MTNEEKFNKIGNMIRELALFVFDCETQEKSARLRRADFQLLRPVFNTYIPPEREHVVSQVNERESGVEKFTQKEMISMPQLKDLSYRYRARDNVHEFRYRRNGINRSFSSTDIKQAKRKALDFCRELNCAEKLKFGADGTALFTAFAESFLENVKKPNVSDKTFRNDFYNYEKHIKPYFADKTLKEISAPFIQRFLNDLFSTAHRTAEACFYILKTVFDYAVNTDELPKSPMRTVKIPLHIRTARPALTLEDEKQFLCKIRGNKYRLNFIVLLYAGCRPCELETVAFEREGFITFRNKKQKKGVVKYKDVPITPMLEPYVEELKRSLPLPKTTELAKIFSALCPGYQMYSLRHTFSTRCQTCGVPQPVVERWLGHSSSGRSTTDRVYTHFPPEYMLDMAKKVVYS